MNERCLEHSGIEARIKNLENKTEENENTIIKAHERVDSMKNWVIAGMSSLILQFLLLIISLVFAYLKLKI